MDDRVERGARVVVSEDDIGHARAIERAVRRHDVRPEAVDDRPEGVGAGLLQLAHDRVGVDQDGSVLGQKPGDRALSGPDAARQSDEQHPSIPSVRFGASGRR